MMSGKMININFQVLARIRFRVQEKKVKTKLLKTGAMKHGTLSIRAMFRAEMPRFNAKSHRNYIGKNIGNFCSLDRLRFYTILF